MLPGAPEPVVFEHEYQVDALVETILELREDAVSASSHYEAEKAETAPLLQAAVTSVFCPVFGEMKYDDLFYQASAMACKIATEHPFSDGNKRTATILMDSLLAMWWDGPSVRDAFSDDALYKLVQAVAERKVDAETFATALWDAVSG